MENDVRVYSRCSGSVLCHRSVLAFLYAAVLLGTACAASAASLGQVLFLRAAKPGAESPVDVYEKDLDTGETKLLISHKSLPDTFRTRACDVAPSFDGRYLWILSSPGWVFHNQSTGETRTVFGYAFSHGGEEEPIDAIDEADWCWERKTGTIRKIDAPQDCIGPGWSRSDSNMKWSPEGNRLLGRQDAEEAPYPSCLYLYDATAQSVRKLATASELEIAIWSAQADGAVEVLNAPKETSLVWFQPTSGERKTLFTWPREIAAIAQSPDGKTFAVFDSLGNYLVGRDGRHIRKLKMPTEEKLFWADFWFNTSGSRLAVLTSYSFGEPHLGLIQQLWVVDSKTTRAHRVARWDESFQGSGLAVDRWIEGWLPDEKSVLIGGAISYGVEKPADSENDWIKIWSYDTVRCTGRGSVLFDSGKGCLGVEWWPGTTARF